MHHDHPLTWTPGAPPAGSPEAMLAAAGRCREPVWILRQGARRGVALDGAPGGDWQVEGWLPPLYPERLGDRGFGAAHGVRFAYVGGEMANGIATVEMVVALARAGMLGFFGAAGLSPARVEAAIDRLQTELPVEPWGLNLIHSPHEPALEEHLAGRLLARGVRRVSASAFMDLTPAVVRLAAAGLRQDATGRIIRNTYVFAKVSRPEVARRFLMPAPAELLAVCQDRGWITAEEAALARRVPVATDLTAEADSGGHTDNQALPALLPVLLALRDRVGAELDAEPVRVGAAGGLGTPGAVAAAFALGADYVLTGSVNQSAVEAGLCEAGRRLLCAAALGDVAMAPAADMFELGVKVQVLRRGTLFAQRAQRLYDLYQAHAGLEALPAEVRSSLERTVFKAPLDQIWAETAAFWRARNPAEVEAAEADPKRRMALVFRWYLGLSSRWAIEGKADRVADYQIWCGPAMAAFNDWARGSFLEDPAQRTVVQIAANLLEGAAVVTRAGQLRAAGLPVPARAFQFTPRPLSLS